MGIREEIEKLQSHFVIGLQKAEVLDILDKWECVGEGKWDGVLWSLYEPYGKQFETWEGREVELRLRNGDTKKAMIKRRDHIIILRKRK